MKRMLTILLASLLLVLAAAMPAVAADPARPFSGSWVSRDGADFAAPGCPAGTFFRYATNGQGTFAHLGITGVALTHCTYFDVVSPTGTFDHGSITLTAADGDVLELAEEGSYVLDTPNLTPPPPFEHAVSHNRWWVVGGTGRFAGASGSGTGESFDNLVTGVQSFSLRGAIAY